MIDSNGQGATEAERELEVHRHLMRFGEAESRVAPVWSARDTNVAAVADHLARLWTMAGDDGPHVREKGLPHARASVLNLIVTVPDEPSAGRVVETMMGLGFRHPSRAIVLVASPGATGPTVDAAVSAHCHAAHEDEEQVCYEEVVLTVRPGFVTTKMTEGMRKAPFTTTPGKVANATVEAIASGKELIWAPRILRYVMWAMRFVPRPVFRRLKF